MLFCVDKKSRSSLDITYNRYQTKARSSNLFISYHQSNTEICSHIFGKWTRASQELEPVSKSNSCSITLWTGIIIRKEKKGTQFLWLATAPPFIPRIIIHWPTTTEATGAEKKTGPLFRTLEVDVNNSNPTGFFLFLLVQRRMQGYFEREKSPELFGKLSLLHDPTRLLERGHTHIKASPYLSPGAEMYVRKINRGARFTFLGLHVKVPKEFSLLRAFYVRNISLCKSPLGGCTSSLCSRVIALTT